MPKRHRQKRKHGSQVRAVKGYPAHSIRMDTVSTDISCAAPFIYVGNRYAATGRLYDGVYIDYLSLYKIKHVISVLTEAEYADYMIAAEDFEDGQTWHRLTADDDPQEPIDRYFSQMTATIRRAVASREAVLIHCAAGMSRSVSIAAAYLIASEGLSAADAVAAIKRARHIADPNRGFMEQLGGFSKTLQ